METDQDLDILARTIYGEARGEYNRKDGGLASLIAIANVVMNRVRQQTWFGKTIGEVCQKPWQFSCWNAGDPNCLIIRQRYIHDPLFLTCLNVAEGVACRDWPDITKRADHYHSVLMKQPKWAVNQEPRMRMGQHLFYQLGR
ncbi:cell wall hydrolase [Candidatus Finniella inopinata]|uniref:Cell wall hydrolase n=1 Tax=Candidatus Finniella inopinata TaxID=1696036 RepID=A0A4V2DZX4_9PROT|nr:cell wall hydrolase [Candidatus Finniella inopinata]RZI46567.1 cell wall hydrolase [Candidatus Finniella inopinata]